MCEEPKIDGVKVEPGTEARLSFRMHIEYVMMCQFLNIYIYILSVRMPLYIYIYMYEYMTTPPVLRRSKLFLNIIL